MIEKFNFYDIYGYLLPGLLLLAFLWLPFGLLLDVRPAASLSSALIASAAAYLLGHFLQLIARGALSFRRNIAGVQRDPADFLLDDTDEKLSGDLKLRLKKQIKEMFNINVSGSGPDVSRKRKDAVLICRGLLIQQKAGFYVEQQEGMYALMRGASTALAIACMFYFGWFLGVTLNGYPLSVISLGLFTVIAASCLVSWCAGGEKVKVGKLLFALVLLMAAVGGFLVNGVTAPVPLDQKTLERAAEIRRTKIYDAERFKKVINDDPNLSRIYEIAERQGVYSSPGLYPYRSGVLLGMALLALFFASECYRGFREFAGGFATTVYRNFYQVTQNQLRQTPQASESSVAD